MKTKIMMLLAAIGLSTFSGYAQKNCTCKKKTVHKKHTCSVAVKKKKTTTTLLTSKSVIQPVTNTTITENLASLTTVPAVNKCMVDNRGEYNYFSENAYLGYRPSGTLYESCAPSEGLRPRFEDLVVTSPAFSNNGVLPAKYTCEGQQASPPLNIENVPEGTQSLAVVMYDPMATASKSMTYWMMWNLDTTGVIPENFINDHSARNPFNKQYGYTAICPVNGEHKYYFTVYALDTKLRLGKDTNRGMLERAMSGHVLAKGELIGSYSRMLDGGTNNSLGNATSEQKNFISNVVTGQGAPNQ